MIVVASANGRAGLPAALDILRSGGSALDAVEAATRVVEADVRDHSVGTGGYPNALGEVEMDASIMEGTTRRAGAVAALHGYPHPISVARAILERLPQHVLLAGAGAARFAAECGFSPAETLTDEAREAWRRRMAGATVDVQGTGQFAPLASLAARMQDPQRTVGTVNFLARDARGGLASAVSTSGWAFKYPGRVGDSPLIGAGNYADDRCGACACTGLGEWAIRGATARTVVLGLHLGLSVEEAAARALTDLATIPLPPEVEPVMSLVALDKDGRPAGSSTGPARTFLWQTPDMASPKETARTVVRL